MASSSAFTLGVLCQTVPHLILTLLSATQFIVLEFSVGKLFPDKLLFHFPMLVFRNIPKVSHLVVDTCKLARVHQNSLPQVCVMELCGLRLKRSSTIITKKRLQVNQAATNKILMFSLFPASLGQISGDFDSNQFSHTSLSIHTNYYSFPKFQKNDNEEVNRRRVAKQLSRFLFV